MKTWIRFLLALQLIFLNACNLAKHDNTNVDLYPTQTLSGADAPAAEEESLEETVDASAADVKVSPAPSAPYRANVSRGRPLGKQVLKESGKGLGQMALAGSGSFGAMAEYENANAEAYDSITENEFHKCTRDPLSTFSIDVDTASYSNVRRMIRERSFPIKDAVRIEEMINYFDYEDQVPKSGEPFAVSMDSAVAPWNSKHRVVRIGIKGVEIKKDKRPASNLVFLIDTSGSMNFENKLPMVRSSLKLLVNQLTKDDKISIVVYAGAAGLVLPPTRGDHRQKIIDAIDNLEAGGSTNGGAGIQLAYKQAEDNYVKGAVNRVILASDGDFNVGVTDRSGLVEYAKQKAEDKHIYLSVLTFGTGNIKDGMMEELSRKANGNYAYIDTMNEARKVLVEQMTGTLITIAKDVKIQVEFNPKQVEGYRLIGYENRMLKSEDFNDDKKDAGEIGAGHTVTALYEVVPAGTKLEKSEVDALKYQKAATAEAYTGGDEWMNVKIRFKKPDGNVSSKIEKPYTVAATEFKNAGEALRFSSSVAMFGMWLRKSQFLKEGDAASIQAQAKAAIGRDPHGYRTEFVQLVKEAAALTGDQASTKGSLEEF